MGNNKTGTSLQLACLLSLFQMMQSNVVTLFYWKIIFSNNRQRWIIHLIPLFVLIFFFSIPLVTFVHISSCVSHKVWQMTNSCYHECSCGYIFEFISALRNAMTILNFCMNKIVTFVIKSQKFIIVLIYILILIACNGSADLEWYSNCCR